MDTQPDALTAYQVEEIAEGVFAYLQPDGGWCLNNAGLVVGRQGTLLIDTAATEARARTLNETVQILSPRPVDFLVNTHSHGDHTFGNYLFAELATVVAHELAAAEMLEHGLALTTLWPQVDWGRIELTVPDVTFTDHLSLPGVGFRVELLHPGVGHTAGDTVVWLPDQRVLFAGDLVFSGVTPFVLMGSVSGSLALLDRLRALKPLVVVPGHGPVGGPELLDRNADYLFWVQRLARTGMEAGLDPLQLARESGPGPFADLLDSERLVGNLARAYAEEVGAAPAEPLDVVAAFGDMVALNGGLMHCSA